MAKQDPATAGVGTDTDQVKLGEAFRVGAEGDEAVQLMVTLLDRQDAALPIRRLLQPDRRDRRALRAHGASCR